MLELYHDWSSFCSLKVRLCLAEKDLHWVSREVNLMHFEHLRPEYLAINPNGLVPTLVDDGHAIIESTVINEYLEEVYPGVALAPRDPLSRARMRVWVKYEDDVLHPVIRPATFHMMISKRLAAYPEEERERLLARHPLPHRAADFREAASAQVTDQQIEEFQHKIQGVVDKLDDALSETPWLAGESYSLADIAAAPFIDRLEELGFFNLYENRASLINWMERIKQRPAYQHVLPKAHQRLSAVAKDFESK